MIEEIIQIIEEENVCGLEDLCLKNSLDTYYANSTEIWLAIACLFFHEKDNEYLRDYADRIIRKPIYWNNLRAFYGIPCLLVLQLFHYQVTRQKLSLDYAITSLEKTIALLDAQETSILKGDSKEYTIIFLLFFMLSESIKNNWFKQYAENLFIKNNNDGTYAFSPLVNIPMEQKKEFLASEIGKLHQSIIQTVFLKIIEKINFKEINIQLSVDRICKMQIEKNFSRTAKRLKAISLSRFFQGSTKDTCLFFSNNFYTKDQEIYSLFLLEKNIYSYRLELCKESTECLREKNKAEVFSMIETLYFSDDRLYTLPFRCAKDLRLIELPYYESKEIEETVKETSSHSIFLKPTYNSGGIIEIKEFQTESYMKFIKHIFAYNGAITPSDLNEIISRGGNNPNAKQFCISVFRKLILQRILVKDNNADAEKR